MFITFEGGEGSGKSTMAQKLFEWLGKEKHKLCLLTREPRESFRKILLAEDRTFTKKTETLLFLADRAEHWVTVIKPSLDAGSWVICDRFGDSTVAYQSYANGFDLGLAKSLNKEVTNWHEPDLTFYLKVDPEVGLARASNPNKYRKMGVDFHKRVQYGFDQLASQNKDRIKVIDASKTQEEVFEEIKSYIEPLLKKEDDYAKQFKA